MHDRACESSSHPKISIEKMSVSRLYVLFLILHHSEITLSMWKQEQMDCQVFFCKAGSVIIGKALNTSADLHPDVGINRQGICLKIPCSRTFDLG